MIWPENLFFEGFNSLGLALGMALKFYASVEKELELKVIIVCTMPLFPGGQLNLLPNHLLEIWTKNLVTFRS